MLRKLSAATLLCGAVAQAAMAGALPVVHGEPVRSAKAASAALSLLLPGAEEPPESTVRLLPLAQDKQLRLQQANAAVAGEPKLLQIGIGRDARYEADAPAPFRLKWITLADGGRAARFSLQSPGARALRLGLAFDGMPEEAQLRVQGAQDPRNLVMLARGREMREAAREQGIYWTPVTEGDRQFAEIYLPPGVAAQNLRVRIESASHLVTSAGDKFSKSTGVGASQSCELDVACISHPTEAFVNASRSVARMVFTSNGASYLCTGTLVNGAVPGSQIPFLHGASHCISSQAAASTLNTFWFFEATFCGAKSAGNYTQLAGGATLLYSNVASDGALLRLNDRAPEGAYFSGWDPNPVEAGMAAITLHHPAGDVKKASSGQILQLTFADPSSGSFAAVAWLSGSTEPGSSGAGLFVLRDGEYLLRGGLQGGSASCANSGSSATAANRDYFSRIDADYGSLKSLLGAPAVPANDYSDAWWNPKESGWGITIVQHPGDQAFVTWYTYDVDGRALWLVMPGGSWTGSAQLRGALYQADGPGYTQPFDPARVSLRVVGEAALDFVDAANANFSYTLNGVTGSKAIT
ncbi:MAG: trypsin-like serine peptidase, partial [Usitatibacter sp.]